MTRLTSESGINFTYTGCEGLRHEIYGFENLLDTQLRCHCPWELISAKNNLYVLVDSTHYYI